MAGRFLFRKLSSQMSRSTGLLHAHASASATAGEPLVRYAREGGFRSLRNFFSGASAHRGTALPNLHGIRGLVSSGASTHRGTAAPNLHGIHGHAAGHLSNLSFARAAPTTSSSASTSGILPAITSKPAFVNSIRVKKRTFSFTPSNNDNATLKPKLPTGVDEWEAKYKATVAATYEARSAACKAEVEGWIAKQDAEDAAFLRSVRIIIGCYCFYMADYFVASDGESSKSDTVGGEGKSGPQCQAAENANPDPQVKSGVPKQ